MGLGAGPLPLGPHSWVAGGWWGSPACENTLTMGQRWAKDVTPLHPLLSETHDSPAGRPRPSQGPTGRPPLPAPHHLLSVSRSPIPAAGPRPPPGPPSSHRTRSFSIQTDPNRNSHYSAMAPHCPQDKDRPLSLAHKARDGYLWPQRSLIFCVCLTGLWSGLIFAQG